MAVTGVRAGAPGVVLTHRVAGVLPRIALSRGVTPAAAHEHNSCQCSLFGPDIMYVRILSDVEILSTSLETPLQYRL